jgi:hypothetical protein
MAHVVERIGPLEVVGRVIVAGVGNGEPRCHRAWPGAALAANGELVVAYKKGSTHHLVDDEIVFVTDWKARFASPRLT